MNSGSLTLKPDIIYASTIVTHAWQTIMTNPPPPTWGTDEITIFFDNARENEYATYVHYRSDVDRLLDIDIAFRKAIDGLNHSKDWFAGFFLLRAHSNFLAACRMSWSGQIPECYALLRSCLENALYGVYLAKNPASQETWLCRHDSDEHKKRVRQEFKISTMLDLAKSMDEKEGTVAEKLYERTIDYGAHPNERALMQALQMTEGDDKIEFNSIYLDKDSDQLKLAIKTTAQAGACALSLFRPIYKERYDILGVTDALDHIKKRL